MKFLTSQLGEIELSEEVVVQFESGIIGFDYCNSFAIVHKKEFDPFRWMVSTEFSDIGFPILNPLEISTEISNELPRNLLKQIFEGDGNVDLYCIANLNGEGGNITINLKSPVIINYETLTGRQIVLPSEKLSVNYAVS